MTSTELVLQLVAAERQRQQDKWGEQNHPNIVSSGTYADAIRGASARFYGMAFRQQQRPRHAQTNALGVARSHGWTS